MTPELYWLSITLGMSALLPFPYVLNRIAVRGLGGALANPSPTAPPLAPWAERAKCAHANAVENLVLYAPAAIALHVLGLGTGLTASAAVVYFFARLTHYLVYLFGIPGLRTLAFFAGWGATAVMVVRLLGAS